MFVNDFFPLQYKNAHERVQVIRIPTSIAATHMEIMNNLKNKRV